MKCPKCGYNSFDNNQVCPKCNRDISYEQEKLNLPAFRPNPPSLLGTLTGEAIESHVDMKIDQSDSEDVVTEIVTEGDVNYEDSGVIDMGEITFDDSGALDSGEMVLSDPQQADLDLGETSEFDAPEGLEPLPEEEAVSDIDLDSLGDSSDMIIDMGDAKTGEEEEISLDLEDLSDEEPEEEGMAPLESTEDEEDEVSFDFDDLALDESDETDASQIQEPEEESEEPGIDFDAIALEEPEPIDEPQIQEPDEESEEPGIDFDAIPLEELEPIDEPQIQEPEEEGEEPDIDFDAIALEEDIEESEELELGLDDLQIDERGELEVRKDSESAESPIEDLLDLGDIDLELDDLDVDNK
jgi:hypothetical protein